MHKQHSDDSVILPGAFEKLLSGQERIESKLDAVKASCEDNVSSLLVSMKKDIEKLYFNLSGEDCYESARKSNLSPRGSRVRIDANAVRRSARHSTVTGVIGIDSGARRAFLLEQSRNDQGADSGKLAGSLFERRSKGTKDNSSRRLYVRIECAELRIADDVFDSESSSCVSYACIVKLDGKQITHTSSDKELEWNHTIAAAYADEETLECVIARAPAGTFGHQPFAVASISLHDDRFQAGFHDFVELIPVDAGGSTTRIGRIKLQISWGESKAKREEGIGMSLSDPSVSTALTASYTSQGRNPSMTSAKSRISKAVKWPTSIILRRGLEQCIKEGSGEDAEKRLRKCRVNLLEQKISKDPSSGDGGRNLRSARRLCSSFWHSDAWSPVSLQMFIYTVVGSLVLSYDCVTVPYVLAWDEYLDEWNLISSWLSSCFWFCNIFVNFSTGYFHHGQIEQRTYLVARHYARTWFLLDLPLVLIDFANAIVCTSGGHLLNHQKVLRLPRVFRILCILRIFKLKDMIDNVVTKDLSEMWRAFIYVWRLLGLILWLGHFCCCLWFYIGRNEGKSTGRSWYFFLDDKSSQFVNAPRLYQYATSYHWALSQLTGSSVEMITPTNTKERLFNICMLVFQVMFGSFLVSTISAKVIEIGMAQQDKFDKTRMVRAFLKQNNIEPQLAIRIQKQLSERLRAESRLREQDVSALDVLSLRIRMELRVAVVGKVVLRHPLYSFCTNIDPLSTQRFCYEAAEQKLVPRGEVLFMHSIDIDNVYCVVRGTFEYKQSAAANPHLEADAEAMVFEGEWMCQPALWTCWRTVGTAEAGAVCDLLLILPQPALEIFLQHPVLNDIVREYGALYHHALITAVPPMSVFPNDLQVPGTSFSELIYASKSNDLRIAIGMLAIMDLRNHTNFISNTFAGRGSLSHLEEEVMNGKSIITIAETGDVQRIVSLSLICLQNQDGRVLAKMGSKKDGEIVSKPGWPGRPLKAGEDRGEELKRFFEEVFTYFLNYVDFPKTMIAEQVTDTQESSSYGISTKYISTLHFGFLDPTADLIPFEAQPLRVERMTEIGSIMGSIPLSSYPVDNKDITSCVNSATEIFMVPDQDGRGCDYYAWLPCKDDLEKLRSHPAGKVIVKKWLHTLEEVPATKGPSTGQTHDSKETRLDGIVPDGWETQNIACNEAESHQDGMSKSGHDTVLDSYQADVGKAVFDDVAKDPIQITVESCSEGGEETRHPFAATRETASTRMSGTAITCETASTASVRTLG